MSTRWAGMVVILASTAGGALAAPPEAAYVDDQAGPVDVQRVLAPRALLPDPSPSEPLTARLVWMDPAHCAVGVETVARDEARSLLRRMNVSATWRVGVAGEIARPGEVRVILLDRAAANRSGQPILGATPPSFDSAPFVWIHVPNVRAALGLRPDVPLSAVDLGSVHSLGVAVGRVIAHELVHALAPSEPHGEGLMSEKLTGHQLGLSRLAVDPAVGAAVRAGLRGEPSAAPVGTALLAAATPGRTRQP